MKLSENLRKILIERNMSVTSLSKLAEVPKTNIQGWLDGASPQLVQIEKVSKVLGLTIEELAFGKNPAKGLEEVFQKIEIHNGLYEVSIKKVSRKDNN